MSQESEGRVWADGLGLASPGQGVCGGELRAFPPSYKLTVHGLGRLARQPLSWSLWTSEADSLGPESGWPGVLGNGVEEDMLSSP